MIFYFPQKRLKKAQNILSNTKTYIKKMFSSVENIEKTAYCFACCSYYAVVELRQL